jgi:hypothetical protein
MHYRQLAGLKLVVDKWIEKVGYEKVGELLQIDFFNVVCDLPENCEHQDYAKATLEGVQESVKRIMAVEIVP